MNDSLVHQRICLGWLVAGSMWGLMMPAMPLEAAVGPGVILYNSYQTVGGQPVAQLSKMGPDGTGDTRIPVSLPEPALPALSRDRRLLAMTSADPAKALTL